METNLNPDDIVRPSPQALIESLRAVGYGPETAIADLVDNSIAAEAKNVWIEFYWNGRHSTVSIIDDGFGMDEAKLVEAMRLGGGDPCIPRTPQDLGRFGLGLKTASFSQCRSLSVIASTNTSPRRARKWDLDHIAVVKDWHLQRSLSNTCQNLLDKLVYSNWRVAVVWEKLDRLVEDVDPDDSKAKQRFLKMVSQVESHLGMVFHRYLERSTKLNIFINGNRVAPWDPFLVREPATQALPLEYVSIPGGKSVEVRPFILPQKSKMLEASHKLAAGPKGWTSQQGFYVYRNNRLLVPGRWLGLRHLNNREQYQLARIRVDIDNSMDSDWQIDIRKSRATPPAMAREHLTRIARLSRDAASQVFKGRRKALTRTTSGEFVFVWEQSVRQGRTLFSINRKHPLVRKFLLDSEDSSAFRALLKMIEQTVPIEEIWLATLDHEGSNQGEEEQANSLDDMKDTASVLFELLASENLSSEQLRRRLAEIEPFHRFPELIDNIVTEHRGSSK